MDRLKFEFLELKEDTWILDNDPVIAAYFYV